MGFRLNIAFSFVFHTLIVAVVCALGFGDAAFRLPEPHMLIALVEGLSDSPPAPEKPGELNKRNIALPTKKSSSHSGDSSHNDLPLDRQETKSDQYPSAPIRDMPSLSLINSELKGAVTDKDMAASGQAQDSGIDMTLAGRSTSPLQVNGISDATVHNAVRQTNVNKGDANADMYRMIRTAIAKALVYPALARKRGIEGAVITEFTISNRGYPENIRIIQSSGYSILDAAARETVLKASPFTAARGWIETPIIFRLEKK